MLTIKEKRFDEIMNLFLEILQLIDNEKFKWFKSPNYENLKIKEKIESVTNKVYILINCTNTETLMCVFFGRYTITGDMIKATFKYRRGENKELYLKKKKLCVKKWKELMQIFWDLIESGQLKNIFKK